MNIFTALAARIREVLGRMIPYRTIEQAEKIETPLSSEMTTALGRWYEEYLNQAAWLKDDTVKSMNLPALISAEIARQVTLELKWNISGGQTEDGEDLQNPRSEYLKAEFEKLMKVLQQKLEHGCAAGGLLIKPYPNPADGHIYFDWVADWALYPMAFDDDGNLSDVIIPDTFQQGKEFYTRLERHTITPEGIRITQRAFQSNIRDELGKEISLEEVDRWKGLQPETTVANTDGVLFGWYKVAAANNIDPTSPLGASVYSKAEGAIQEADFQWSRILWEFEGSELAIDVDPTALRPKRNGSGMETPKLNERLFRSVDIDKGDHDLYEVFSPNIRDQSLLNGLNEILIRVEDLSGLSRGTFSNANIDARTATELKINKQRTYSTITKNQEALERCLRDVVRVMNIYATLYHLAPEGDYDISFEWDDSILTDTDTELNERMLLYNSGIIGKSEMRQWFFGETKAQAEAAIQAITDEETEKMNAMMQTRNGQEPEPEDGDGNGGGPLPE